MADIKEVQTIQYIQTQDGEVHPIDAITLEGKNASSFQTANLVTTIDASSTDSQYPSAKCVWDKLNAATSTYVLDMTDDGSVRCIKNGTDNAFAFTDDGSVTLI